MPQPIFEPMTAGGILDRTFKIYRDNFVRFIAIVAVVQVPLAIITWILFRNLTTIVVDSRGQAHAQPGPLMIAVGITVLLYLIAQQLTSGALVKSVSEYYLGREVTVGEAYGAMSRRLGSLIWASVLVSVLIGIGSILLIIPGVIFTGWFMLATPAIVVESLGAGGAIGRSKRLMSGNVLKGLGVLLLVGVIGWVVGMATGFVGAAVSTLVGGVKSDQGQYVTQFFDLVSRVIVTPIGSAAVVLLYYDMRIRKEGFDLEMLSKTFRGAQGDGVVVAREVQ